jgi:biopolymer transport protein ExbB/TolQ
MGALATKYFQDASVITWFVMFTLSAYFIATLWIFIYRFFYLNSWLAREKEAVELILNGNGQIGALSILARCIQRGTANAEACLKGAAKEATVGLSTISIFASTSPFVGLFGTVVSILDSFARLGTASAANSVQAMAPAISEALVATACGIFVAIPAYAFHTILKRKSYEVITFLQMQVDLTSKK